MYLSRVLEVDWLGWPLCAPFYRGAATRAGLLRHATLPTGQGRCRGRQTTCGFTIWFLAVFRLIFFQNSISFKMEGVICFSGMIFTKRFPIRQALVRSYIYIFIRIPQDFCHFSCKPCTRGYKGFLDILGGSHMPIDLRFPSFRGTYHRTTSEEGGAGELKLSQGVPLPSSPLYKISFLK